MQGLLQLKNYHKIVLMENEGDPAFDRTVQSFAWNVMRETPELGADWISGILQLFFIVLLIGTPIITLIILLSLLLASAVYNGVAGEGKGVSFRLRDSEAGLVLNKISLRSIGYWLPSHLAVNVVSGLLAMLLGSMNLTSLLFSIGLSIPLLWLTAWLYNLFSGKGGITLRLSEEGE